MAEWNSPLHEGQCKCVRCVSEGPDVNFLFYFFILPKPCFLMSTICCFLRCMSKHAHVEQCFSEYISLSKYDQLDLL